MASGHRVPARSARLIASFVSVTVLLAGCADDESEPADTEPSPGDAPETNTDAGVGDGRFPDVIAATASADGDGAWRFDVTLSSPYDTPDRYADAWRVVAPDGTVLGVRELLHDHQNEQPFTRSLSGVVIPDAVTSVTIEGRDQRNGWGGATVEVALP